MQQLPSRQDDESEDEEAENQRVYEEVMRKVLSSSDHNWTRQGQGETPNNIVEALIDRMPTHSNKQETSPSRENYLSPVAHAQKLLNAYKATNQNKTKFESIRLNESY
jgi:hypothetical protein